MLSATRLGRARAHRRARWARPAPGRCRPPFLCAASMVLSSILLGTWAVDLVLNEGAEGKTRRMRVRTDGPGRAATVQSQRPAGRRWLRWAAAPTRHGMPAGRGPALRAEAGGGVGWGGGESDYVLLLNRNWNGTKYFQISPDPPRRAAGSCTAQAAPGPQPLQRKGF